MHFPFFPPSQKSIGFLGHVFVYLKDGQKESWLLIYPMHLCVLVLLYMFISMLFSWNQLMGAWLFCKLFYLSLLWVHTCFEVLAASHLSKMLESKASTCSSRKNYSGYMKKGGGVAFLVDFLLQGVSLTKIPKPCFWNSSSHWAMRPCFLVSDWAQQKHQAGQLLRDMDSSTDPLWLQDSPRPPSLVKPFLEYNSNLGCLYPTYFLLPSLSTKLAWFVHTSQLSYIF